MKKILSGIFTATIIAAITFTSCSSPASGSNSSNNSSNDNQFSFDDFEPAALPQFQGVNPLTGKTYYDDYTTLVFTNNTITHSFSGNPNIFDLDYSIDTTNNLIYVRYSKSYVLAMLNSEFENKYAQCVTPDEKEFWNEVVINFWIKSFYSKFSCYKYILEGNNLTFIEAYSNQTNENKEFWITIPSKYNIALRENYIYIETFDNYPHNQYWSKLSALDGNFTNPNFFTGQNEISKNQGTFAGTISITTAQDPTQSKCTITFTQLPSEIPDSNSLLNTPLTLTPKCGKISAGTYTLQQ